MPNRIIKESIHESEKVNKMSDFQFRLWINLITYVDDYGRGDARPAIIKGKCFPLRERLTNADISAALKALADIGCVGLYEIDGKSYLYLPRWESHQRIRNKVPRFPAPKEEHLKKAENIEFQSSLPQLAADCRNSPQLAARIQSESESELESESFFCAELRRLPPSTPQESANDPVIFLPLNDGSEYPVCEEQCQEWAGLYPAVNVIQQLRSMRGWLLANPRNVSKYGDPAHTQRKCTNCQIEL